MGLDETWAPVGGGAQQQGSHGESPLRWVRAGALGEAGQQPLYVEGPLMEGPVPAPGATGWEVCRRPPVHWYGVNQCINPRHILVIWTGGRRWSHRPRCPNPSDCQGP